MFTLKELLFKSEKVLFKSMQEKARCINQLLPSSKTNGYMLKKKITHLYYHSVKKLLLVGPFYLEFVSVFCNAALCEMLPLNILAITKF